MVDCSSKTRPQNVVRDRWWRRQMNSLRVEAILVGGVGQHDRHTVIADPRGRALHRLSTDAALLRLDAIAGGVFVRVGTVRFEARLVRQDVGGRIVSGRGSQRDGSSQSKQSKHLRN
uniref:Uncharacterized protein n=1 Tax=Anopheles merus TaxID=30066 RepID=A0A182VC43_ANOME